MTWELVADILSVLAVFGAYCLGRRAGRKEVNKQALQNARSLSAGLRMSRGPD